MIASRDEILTAAEAAVKLLYSQAHVYDAIAGKKDLSSLPAISMGRRKLVRRSALEQWKTLNEASRGGVRLPHRQQSEPLDA
ncbi:MAG TPA: hypothetical protein VG675_00645 [Bryobacteraceae bacterium]|nr:hypothetical protein [Bryobacteraceae bacterium]